MLAAKLCSKDLDQDAVINAKNILHIARVVLLDLFVLDDFIEQALFMLKNEGATIPNHLASMQRQPLMHFGISKA